MTRLVRRIYPPSAAILKALHRAAPVATDCSNRASLPPLTLAIGNASYTIPSSLYVVSGDVNGGNRSECVSAFMAGGDPFWLMGDVFFRAVYAVLDVEHKLYGMARNVNLELSE